MVHHNHPGIFLVLLLLIRRERVINMANLAPIISEQYPATDETQCINVIIPAGDEFKALLAGLLSVAANPLFYDDPDSAQTDGLCAIWDTAYSETEWNGCMIPSEAAAQGRVSLWAKFSDVSAGNAPALQIDAAQMFAYYMPTVTPANGDVTQQQVYLAAGNYAARVLYVRLTNNAKLTVRLINDDTSTQYDIILQGDLYGTTLRNQELSGNIDIPESGLFTIQWIADGKNASSSSYNRPITMTELWRTGDI